MKPGVPLQLTDTEETEIMDETYERFRTGDAIPCQICRDKTALHKRLICINCESEFFAKHADDEELPEFRLRPLPLPEETGFLVRLREAGKDAPMNEDIAQLSNIEQYVWHRHGISPRVWRAIAPDLRAEILALWAQNLRLSKAAYEDEERLRAQYPYADADTTAGRRESPLAGLLSLAFLILCVLACLGLRSLWR